MAGYEGDYLSGASIPLWYHSFNSLGASATPSSIGTVIVYKNSDVTGTSVGVSLHSIAWNGKVGMNLAVIDSSASANYYNVGGKFHVIASLTTIDGQLVNVPVGDFTIQKTYQAGLIHRGTFAAGGASSFSLDATLRSSTSSYHDGNTVFSVGSTGGGQARVVGSFAGATGTVTPDRALTTAVVSTGSYELYAGSLPSQDSELADSILSRNIATGSFGGRNVSSALYPLRNKVTTGGSTMTVFGTDDSTSAWTASITTAGSALASIDPQGP